MNIKEIEHRWLLYAYPLTVPCGLNTSSATVKNGYITTDSIQERFTQRRYNWHPTFKKHKKLYRRTVKIGHGIERFEFKDKIDKKLFKLVWPLTIKSRIRKTRVRVPVGKLLWEIDTFHDRNLFLAEVEVPNIRYKFEIPKWLKPYIIREVTDEYEYERCNLAK